MRREERAAQIWPILTYAASLRATLTYRRLGELIGAPPVALGDWMEPVQSYCILRELPPLTVLVVSDATGIPGDGFTGADNVSQAQANVFQRDWREVHVPSAAELAAAAAERPSNGVPRRSSELGRESS